MEKPLPLSFFGFQREIDHKAYYAAPTCIFQRQIAQLPVTTSGRAFFGFKKEMPAFLWPSAILHILFRTREEAELAKLAKRQREEAELAQAQADKRRREEAKAAEREIA
eukprot:jgi/Psemu1/49897/gm1.49897_g